MYKKYLNLILIITITIKETEEIKFQRKILALGFPYYKILMTLGTCKEKILFVDQKVWAAVKLNRIIDIYYNSKNPDIKISRAEIKIVINNTDCYASSESGIGNPEFLATLYLPTNIGVMFHSLKLYTCGEFEITKENHRDDYVSKSSESDQYTD